MYSDCVVVGPHLSLLCGVPKRTVWWVHTVHQWHLVPPGHKESDFSVCLGEIVFAFRTVTGPKTKLPMNTTCLSNYFDPCSRTTEHKAVFRLIGVYFVYINFWLYLY